MLKGLPQEKRNANWHKKHMKKLAKDKRRQKYHNEATREATVRGINVEKQKHTHRRRQEAAEQDYKATVFWKRIWLRFYYLKSIQTLASLIERYYKKVKRIFIKEDEQGEEIDGVKRITKNTAEKD